MNIPAAIRLINDARHFLHDGSHSAGEIRALLGEALAALKPQRYVLGYDYNKLPLIIDTHHPDYDRSVVPRDIHPWVVCIWVNPCEGTIKQACSVIDHLNSALPHENHTTT